MDLPKIRPLSSGLGLEQRPKLSKAKPSRKPVVRQNPFEEGTVVPDHIYRGLPPQPKVETPQVVAHEVLKPLMEEVGQFRDDGISPIWGHLMDAIIVMLVSLGGAWLIIAEFLPRYWPVANRIVFEFVNGMSAFQLLGSVALFLYLSFLSYWALFRIFVGGMPGALLIETIFRKTKVVSGLDGMKVSRHQKF